jgi:putative glycosyltransferase (TIGR04372 family)
MEDFDHYLAAGHGHLAAESFTEAANAFAVAHQIAPESYPALRGLGIALSYLNLNAAEGYTFLEAAAKLNGGCLDGQATQAYALSLAFSGQAERSAGVLDALVAEGGTSTQVVWRLEQHWHAGNMVAAATAADDLLRHADFWSPAEGGPAMLTPQAVMRTVIGEQANRLDLIVKARILGWPVPQRMVLDARGNVANSAFLDYWRPHFEVLEGDEVPGELTKLLSTFAFRGADGNAYVRNLAYALLNREWAARGLPPVLSLTPEHRERGAKALREMGVPEGAWHVGLHVRSSSFNDDGHDNHNALRNAPIESYLPAIRRIVEAGGWVLRMGDAGMAPMQPMEGVIDYAVGPWKSDWMDVFLCGSSAFFVATQSGLQCVAQVFGVPLVVTNVLPNSIYTVAPDDLYIPRKLFSRRENRLLTFRESFRPPYVNKEAKAAYTLLEVDALHHTPEEVLDVVGEAVDRHLGRAAYTVADQRLQQRFLDTVNYHGYGQMGWVGRKFLRDHMQIL